jgi:hypothetical protein
MPADTTNKKLGCSLHHPETAQMCFQSKVHFKGNLGMPIALFSREQISALEGHTVLEIPSSHTPNFHLSVQDGRFHEVTL